MKGEYYRMDFNAWDEGTVDLPLEQEAAYLRVCHQMYRMSGPIPNSPKLLRAIFRCGHNKAQALLRKLIAAKKITLSDDGFLSQSRVNHELVYRESLASLRRVSGGLGGSRSGVARRKSLNGHDTDEPIASTLRSRGEERREEEKERPPDGGPKKAAPRGTRLPPEWVLSPEDENWAVARGMSREAVARTALKFKNHWLAKSGKDATKVDWSRTWQNWVLTDIDRARETGPEKFKPPMHPREGFR